MAGSTLKCPYCGHNISIRDKECRECGCPMWTILSALKMEPTENAEEGLDLSFGADSNATGSAPAASAFGVSNETYSPEGSWSVGGGTSGVSGETAAGIRRPAGGASAAAVSLYRTLMAARAADPRSAALYGELSAVRQKIREERSKVSRLSERMAVLEKQENRIAGTEQELAGLQDAYDRIGGLFAGMRRDKKMREIKAVSARLEEMKRIREALRQKFSPGELSTAESRLSRAVTEEERLRDRILAFQGSDLARARQAIMDDGALLEQAILDRETFAYLDCDIFFKSGLDPVGPAVRALAGNPEALARLQVKDLPADLLEQVEGSYRTSVLGSYGWTPDSLAGWIRQCCKEQPALAGYEIMTNVQPAYFGVRADRGTSRPVELLLLKNGKPVLAVHTAARAEAKTGMRYVKQGCRKQGIAYTHLLTEYPNYRHYVVRRLLEAMSAL